VLKSIFVNAKIPTYFVLQNEYFHIYEDTSFVAKILKDDCAHRYLGKYVYNSAYDRFLVMRRISTQ